MGAGLILGGLGALASVPMGIGAFNDLQKSTRENILQGGPNADGKFETDWFQNFLIDEQSLVPQYNKRTKKTVMNDPMVTQMQMQLGDDFLYQDGWDTNKTASANAGAYKKSLTEEKRQANIQSYTDLYNTPQQVEERRINRELRQDTLAERRAQRESEEANRNMTLQLGQINARTAQGNQALQREMNMLQNNTTLQLAQMDSELADKRMAFDRETRSMDKRDRAIAQLMSGIGQLGGAFAL